MLLAAMWYHTVLGFFFAVVALLLMVVILLQRGKGVGLAGAFGGAGGGTAFGAKTGDVLTWVTIVGAVLVLTFTVVLNYVFVPSGPGLGGAVAPPPPGVPVSPAGAPVQMPPAQAPPAQMPPAQPIEGSPAVPEQPAQPGGTPEGSWGPGAPDVWSEYAVRMMRAATEA